MTINVQNEEINIDTYLNSVSYEVSPDYVPSIFAQKFVIFIQLVNGAEGEENKTPITHYYMLDTLVSGNNRLANLCHRGLAKTTIFGVYLILYIAVYGEIDGFGRIELGLYVSDSIDNGVKNMRKNLEFTWENSEFLQEYIPEIRFTDIRWEFINKERKKTIFKGYGAKTRVRGTQELGKRPRLAILDDLISDEDAESPTSMEKIEDTVYKAVNFALHPNRNMVIWSGTPFNANDPLYKAVESGAWAVNVFPICEHFPCTREEFRGSWEDRHTYDYVLAQYNFAKKSGNIAAFYQELMLRIMSEEDRLISDSELGWYSRNTLLQNKSQFNFYITTDFTTSEKQKADLSVILVWALSAKNMWYLVDGVAERQTIDKSFNMLFKFVQMYQPYEVGIEVSGQQQANINFLRNEMITRNIFFRFASDKKTNEPGIRPITNKLTRFNSMVPVIKAGRLCLPVEWKEHPLILETLDELQLASKSGLKSRYDDVIDGISMLGSLNPVAPSQNVTYDLVQKDNIWEFETQEEYDGDLSSYIV